MNTDALLERVLDKIDGLAIHAAETSTDMKAVKDHLAKLNGSVQRHEKELNDAKLWRATHEQNCKPRISDKTVLKCVGMICGTALTMFGAHITGFTEALLTLIK